MRIEEQEPAVINSATANRVQSTVEQAIQDIVSQKEIPQLKSQPTTQQSIQQEELHEVVTATSPLVQNKGSTTGTKLNRNFCIH